MSFDAFDREPPHETSSTGHIADALALFAPRPEPDTSDQLTPLEETAAEGALVDMTDALVSTLTASTLEPELESLLWGVVHLFHRAAERLERQLDDNEQAQRRSQREQDGSEVRSVELERLLTDGQALLERRDGLELLRDHAVRLFGVHTGSRWRPPGGTLASRRTLTAAVIDSRDFIAARRRAENETLLPPGPRVAFTGGYACEDHRAIWAALDRVRAKHTGMILLHGGSPKGAEHIAGLWARERGVPQVAFRPDFKRYKAAAPFRRNDAILEALPIGLVVFPGNGINDNLADKAKAAGIPVFDFRRRGGG